MRLVVVVVLRFLFSTAAVPPRRRRGRGVILFFFFDGGEDRSSSERGKVSIGSHLVTDIILNVFGGGVGGGGGGTRRDARLATLVSGHDSQPAHVGQGARPIGHRPSLRHVVPQTSVCFLLVETWRIEVTQLRHHPARDESLSPASFFHGEQHGLPWRVVVWELVPWC